MAYGEVYEVWVGVIARNKETDQNRLITDDRCCDRDFECECDAHSLRDELLCIEDERAARDRLQSSNEALRAALENLMGPWTMRDMERMGTAMAKASKVLKSEDGQ